MVFAHHLLLCCLCCFQQLEVPLQLVHKQISQVDILLIVNCRIGKMILICFVFYVAVKKFVIAHLGSSLFPILFLLSQALRTYTTLIPMTARMGPQANPELVIAALTIIFGILSTAYVVSKKLSFKI